MLQVWQQLTCKADDKESREEEESDGWEGWTGMMCVYAAVLLFLVPCSVWDVRTRTIPVWWLASGGVLSLVAAGYQYCAGNVGIWEILMAISPGLGLLALSLITEQQIGVGDGICVLIPGLLVGTPAIYMITMLALLLSSGAAVTLLITHRGSRKSRMPWIPFVTVSVMLVMVWEGCL